MSHQITSEGGANLAPSAPFQLGAEGGASLSPAVHGVISGEGGASLAPAAPDAITSEGGTSTGLEVTISGITAPTELNSVLRRGSSTLNGRRQYNLDGGTGGSGGAQANRLRWLGTVSGWLLERYVNNVLAGRFRSLSDVVNPWDATGWTAETGTGAPVVTLTAGPGDTGALAAEGAADLAPAAPAQLTPESSY